MLSRSTARMQLVMIVGLVCLLIFCLTQCLPGSQLVCIFDFLKARRRNSAFAQKRSVCLKTAAVVVQFHFSLGGIVLSSLSASHFCLTDKKELFYQMTIFRLSISYLEEWNKKKRFFFTFVIKIFDLQILSNSFQCEVDLFFPLSLFDRASHLQPLECGLHQPCLLFPQKVSILSYID